MAQYSGFPNTKGHLSTADLILTHLTIVLL